MSSAMRSVLCIGEALWDLLPAGKVPGGAPMNVALRLAAFGTPARLLTRVGADAAGQELVEFMAGLGLDTRFVQTDPIQPTGFVTVDTRDPHAARYDIAMPVAWDFIDAAEYRACDRAEVDVIVYGSLGARHPVSRASQRSLIEAARLRVFDVNLRPPYTGRDIIEPLLCAAHWVKLNDSELRRVADWLGVAGDDEERLLRLREHYGLELICVTLGADGAILLGPAGFVRQPAFPVTVVDSIGCGDAFLGALLAGLLGGATSEVALRRACAAGAIIAGHAGGNPALGDHDIDALLARQAT